MLMPGYPREHALETLLQHLRERAYRRGTVTLASGKTSDFYIDCKQVTLSAEGHVLVGQCLWDRIRNHCSRTGRSVTAVGGLTLGADPLASAVAMTSALTGAPVAAFIVRKEPKGHGTGAWLEGVSDLSEGDELVVLEDVVTTGGSALKAVERVRARGFVVRTVFALVDRLDGGREAIADAGLELDTLFTRNDFIPGS
ncbi:MAG: orotate phosphoribosyltransferase [Myxococcales bacterium]|nr:orotate phosphoribosyltransferase [Myxococcales bacterium]